ncbi:chorismate-binding protein [Reichenbachiella versicolor]|uniref:chorismate-binding protein n=1 Tax=Reichenbachiella versicolor TaxID=1821036 RepID=UPI000D6E2BE9|nr:chorismate-binding protein [Reichenbachiella versicolor]
MAEQRDTISILPELQLKNLTKFFNTAFHLDIPLAIWRHPEEKSINGIAQLENIEFPERLESAGEGFLFNPFEIDGSLPKHFISADIFYKSDEGTISPNPRKHLNANKTDAFFESLNNEEFTDFKNKLSKAPILKESKNEFIDLVNQCKKLIKSGAYQKIVPARQSQFSLKEDFNPIQEFLALVNTYTHAFISLVYIPDYGLWIGATPELLISLDKNSQFETVSLAGTQGVPEDFNLSNASWRQKEIEEQALVSRYIINCFKKIRLREFEEYGPKTVKAANLIHLKTTFKVNIDEVNFPELASVMLDLLHPTSAVCGMPMEKAARFIKENETPDRQYFSGHLGPVNINNEIKIFVNLRCARIYKDSGIVFAGAGVTEDSDAESEWNETQIKFQTLLNIIGIK